MAFGIDMNADGVPTLFRSSTTAAIHQWPLITTRHEWSGEKKGTPVVVTHVRTRKNQPLAFHERADGLVDAVFVGMVKRREGGREVTRPLLRSTLECGKRQTAEACYFAFADDAQSVAGLVQFMAEQRAERQMAHLFCIYADGRKKELAAIGKRSDSVCEHPAARCRGEWIEEQTERIRPMSTCVPFSEVLVIGPGDPAADDIKIDPEFRALVPAISDDERMQLEQNLIDHGGARDPLMVWLRGDDDEVLLDGHNRFEICRRLKLPFAYHHVEFDTRDEAADWIDKNQMGRRNLSVDGRTLLIGRIYNRTKNAEHDGGKGKKRSGGQTEHHSEKTSDRVAREQGVSAATVRRAGKYQAAAVELGIEREIAAGKVKATQAEVVKAAATLPDKPKPADVAQAREAMKASAGKRGKGKQPDKPTAGESRRRNSQQADKVTRALIALRTPIELLARTDSAYRDQSLAELQRLVNQLTRVEPTSPAEPDKRQPDNELRKAVAERWEKMRQWEKHWSLAEMKDVRRLFIEFIRDEQKQMDK